MKLKEFLVLLSPEILRSIESRAELNQGPSEIAEALELDKRNFLRLWRKSDSEIREAYERGRAEIERKKEQVLLNEVERSNVTAIQIHDKKVRARRFEDIKNEIFNFE